MEKVESPLVQYIKSRVHKLNKDLNIVIVGAKGSGKTYAALKLGEILDPTFSIDRVGFDPKDFMNINNELVSQMEDGVNIEGKVPVWDEVGVGHDSKRHMSSANRVINYHFQTSRHLNLITIITVPYLSLIDSSTRKLFNCIMEMEGINKREKTATLRVKFISVNALTGKEYAKYLRYRLNNKTYALKRIKLKLPSKPLLEEYEKRKKEFSKNLNKEIMLTLDKEKEKAFGATKKAELTERQKETLDLLTKHSTEEVANIQGVGRNVVYASKMSIEKKGYRLKPIKEEQKVVRYEIEVNPMEPHRKPNELPIIK